MAFIDIYRSKFRIYGTKKSLLYNNVITTDMFEEISQKNLIGRKVGVSFDEVIQWFFGNVYEMNILITLNLSSRLLSKKKVDNSSMVISVVRR